MCLLPSLKWSSTVSSLGIVQWNFTRRDHPGNPRRVSGSGPVRFENGLKLSIRGRIVGLRLRDRDSMVGMALTIEGEIEDARSTRDAGVGSKREDQPSSSSGKRQKTSASHEFQDQGQD